MSLVIILALAGIISISLEVILPGMIMGILGVILCSASIVTVFNADDLPPVFLGFGGRVLLSTLVLLVTVTSVGIWLKYFDRFPWAKGLVLKSSSDGKIENLEKIENNFIKQNYIRKNFSNKKFNKNNKFKKKYNYYSKNRKNNLQDKKSVNY